MSRHADWQGRIYRRWMALKLLTWAIKLTPREDIATMHAFGLLLEATEIDEENDQEPTP